jgi:hypothetical protein
MTEPRIFDADEKAAAAELARRLRAFCDPAFIGDFDHFAAAFVAWQLDHRWRVIPPPPDWRIGHGRPGTEPTDEWREAKAKITGEHR